jgi:hypothetical protein
MPEFFLKKVFKGVKRAVSSVAKGVSKAVSQVGKVLKKVAPLVLPVVLTPILGPIYAGAVGAGIGSLIQGKSIKESLRAALVGAGTGAVFAGAKAKLGGGTFTGGIREAAANPGARFSQLGQAVGESVTERSFSPLTQKFQAPTASAELEAATGVDKSPIETTPVEASSVDKSQIVGGTRKAGSLLPDVGTPELMADQERFLGQGLSDAAKQNVSTLPKFNPADLDTRTFLQKSTDTIRKGLDTGRDVYSKYLSPSRNVLSDADQISRAKELVNLSGGELTFDKALERVVANTGGNIVTNYAPLAGIAGLGAYAGGFFDAAPQDDPDLVDQTTGAELIAQNPDDYMIQDLTPRAASQPFAIPTRFTQLPPLARQLRTSPFVRPAAKGGAMFPRRTGGIDPNEGTPGEDSVRALLMPGEFVMTTDAVRGAGNGSLNQGINNMYSMMRNFESKGRVA